MEAIRETIYCRVTYTYELDGLAHLAQGWMRDFSHTECAIRGRLLAPIGSPTRLTLHLRDGGPPVSLMAACAGRLQSALVYRFDQWHDKDCTRIQRYLLDLHYVTTVVW